MKIKGCDITQEINKAPITDPKKWKELFKLKNPNFKNGQKKQTIDEYTKIHNIINLQGNAN